MKTGETIQQRAKRNWKEYRRSTKERHANGNPDAVQYLLGHSSLAYVQIYTQLAAQFFGDQEYVVIEARSSEQRREASRKGFEFVEKDSDGVSWYRKPKID